MELLELWTTVIQASNCTYTGMFRASLLFEASRDNEVKHRGGEESWLCLHLAVFAMADSSECRTAAVTAQGIVDEVDSRRREGRTSPRLLCVATQQKNTGQNLEEDQNQSQNEQKVEPSSAEKMLTEEKAKLEEQLKEVTDKYKRALADAENVRQRSQKLVEEAKLYGIQSFCKDLLEVADILEKATESVPKEEIKDENPHLKSLYEGLVMTEVQIQKVFKKHGLLRLNPVGAKFDPYEHEALFHAPMEGKEPGTIALVSKIGYKLHGRTLRPALVGVVKDA
ncbi:PREDICTED: grpE protein homolog 1, mitochondrial [Charadrius vociferus]|nr:PREDICTED: grpE protein homolog 1, mitochondrial [Charadrius vociferus]